MSKAIHLYPDLSPEFFSVEPAHLKSKNWIQFWKIVSPEHSKFL